MEYIIPASIKKTIRFPRLSSKNVVQYDIYTKTVDPTYDSGIKTELIDTIKNPNIPSPVVAERTYTYTNNATWKLPKDIYLDRDHRIRIFVDNALISNLYFTVNKLAGVFTINTNAISVNKDSVVRMEYYMDVIEKSYMVEKDCEFIIKPIMVDSFQYGRHNVIL